MHRLSILGSLAAIVSAFCADVAVFPVRQPGASLDTSLRNEADHAIEQAARWLADRQGADGAWGETDRTHSTALVLSALSAARKPGYSDTYVRAALWLNDTETNRLGRLDTHAWRLLALTLSLPETPGRVPILQRLVTQAQNDAFSPSDDGQNFWAEILAQAGFSAPPPPSVDAPALLAHAAANWPPPFAGNRAVWCFARLVNRAGGGHLLRDQKPIDWRPDIARRLINSQKKDSCGGGFWPSSAPDRQIAETAYGILCLLEL